MAVAAFSAGTAAAGERNFEAIMVGHHNAERARIGVQPLAWDADLAHAAGQWARHLAVTRQFDHAPDPGGDAPQGENLWMGTASAFSHADMIDAWIEEKRYYRAGRFPAVTTTSDWSDVGHYTQVIWHSTTHVGCAVARGDGNDVLVCRYAPAGNWEGEFPTGKRPQVMAHASVAATSLANASAR